MVWSCGESIKEYLIMVSGSVPIEQPRKTWNEAIRGDLK